MKQPQWVTDKSSWRKHCRRVVARATELIEGKLNVVDGSRAIAKLAFWLRASEDPDFMIFQAITDSSEGIPEASERQKWPGKVKELETKQLTEIAERWQGEAMAAAQSLRKKYEGGAD